MLLHRRVLSAKGLSEFSRAPRGTCAALSHLPKIAPIYIAAYLSHMQGFLLALRWAYHYNLAYTPKY